MRIHGTKVHLTVTVVLDQPAPEVCKQVIRKSLAAARPPTEAGSLLDIQSSAGEPTTMRLRFLVPPGLAVDTVEAAARGYVEGVLASVREKFERTKAAWLLEQARKAEEIRKEAKETEHERASQQGNVGGVLPAFHVA